MPSKVQLYAQMADRTAEQITGSYQKWTAFLTTAARLYKYPYNEQLMIFAQRPEATACAEYDLWNKQMRRYVRRGSKGIALVDTSSDQPKLRYVFDVSDTSGGENSRRPYLWEYRQEHREVVSAALEQRFDVSGENGLADQMERVAAQLVDEYWHDNRRDIVGIVDGSFLEDYDEFNIGAAFRNAAVVSTTYALLSRCGMQPRDYFEHEDFLNVFDFNTPQTVAALGTAISQSSELVLRQIEVTIKNYEREKIAERSESHERTDLHPQRGLSDSRPEPDRAAASPAGQVRQDAEELPEGASSGAVEQPAAVREAVPPSAGDRRGGEQPAGTDDAGADEVGGRDGIAESQRPDEVGRADEHAESAGRGNDPHGTGVQLNMFDAPAGAQMSFFPSEAEQIQSIAEAESVTPSAFSMFISQDDIDHILRAGGNADAARMKIAAEFSKQKPLEDRAAFLKALYYGGNGLITDNGRFSAWYGDDGIHIATGDTSRYLRSAQVIGWADAAERIEELLDGGTFATNLEVTEAPRYERLGIAVDVWNLYHDFSDEAKSLGYLSCLGNIHSTSFPEETERLTDDLLNPAFRDRLLSEYKVFMDAYHENRALLRFHYHRPQALLTRLEDLSLPRKEFRSDMTAVPATGRFITEDEIAASLANGSSFEGGKTRIYAFFQTQHTPKESADFLKKEYGIGGHTHAVSRESGSYEDHGSKGITLKKAGCADVRMNWNKVASRISELIRMNRYFTPDEQALYDKAQAQDVVRNTAYDSYNAIKESHPDNIVLFQVGDFFEMYGEDAKQAAELLDLNLTTREIPGAGRVEMCGVPSHNLEMYVEKLRDKYDVTIAEAPDFRGERHIYTLRSIDHEAEAAINAYEAEFGADGTRVFRDPAAEQVQPTVQERLEHYRPVVMAAVSEDTAYRNACGHSDRENAEIECNAAVRRAVLNSKDMELIRLFSDVPEFRSRLHQEVFEGTYERLHDLLRPLSQDDIDDALRAWNGNIESKHAVVRYMQQHGREKETAAWLAHEYGGKEGSNLFIVRAGSPETVELTWPKVQRRIAQLIREDNFYTEAERDNFDDIDPAAIREALAQRGIVGGKVVDPEKLNSDPFIQRVMQDTERVAEQALMERAKGLISDFCRSEYGSEADFSDPAKIGVAYTTVTDDEIPIQVNIDLVNYRLERYLDDEHETFETPRYLRGQIEISYVPYTAEWQVSRKSMVRYNDVAAFTTYGTDRASAYRLLEDALNLRDIRIYDTIEDADGRERRVLNAKETTLAAQKQQLIRDAFKDWIWKDPERRETLVRQYNEEMNSTRPREYDGSHIVFSGMNPEITRREHQKNAIAHVLYGGNTLLAHEVGAGKTFEMVASAMESKRLGLCQKSIFVVPNHLTEQWASEFLRLYPSANILVTTKKDFETHNRKKFCARIATGDYDAVIIGHSQFERIPISPERQEQLLHQQIEEITDGIQDTKLAGGNSFTIKSLERTKKGLEARLKKLQASDRKDDVIYFEQLGVDRMFVDESDNYKNLFLYTKMRNVAGLSTTDAQKSSDMFSKCRYMDELTGGRGVVFATGTPVSNSMTELYTIQRYLQHDRLQEMGMGHFDCWASRFGETTTALELAPEGTGYRARTRFAKFFNLPELMNLFKEVADIKTADQLHLPTPEVAYHTIATKPTQIQQDMVKALSERASKVHSGAVSPDVDNMLKITSDGRKLGLDQRIINPMLPDEETTKVNQCVANILQYWRNGEADKLTQLVFCDISTPKTAPSQRAAKASPGTLDSPEIRALESAIPLEESSDTPFTVYEDVRQKLIDAGMPPEQIAFIHDANTEVKKRELFAKVRSGQVRVLMGSTAKMGAGTNVQDRLVALHDLDCPWRPRDLTQRKGRIERQGNQNKLVHVCRYVTEGTFDAYLWQTVENKQKFISQIMTSKSPVRSCEDVDATALSFAEIKALCAGDPRIKECMDLDIEVSKLKIMKADHNSKQFRLEDSLLKYFPEKIEEHKGFVRGLEADMQTLAAHPLPAESFVGMEIRGDRLTDKENAGAALLDTCKEVKGKDPVQIGSYRGFTMSVAFDSMWKTYTLTLKGQMTHRVELGSDARGNLVRIENALDKMPERLRSVQEQLENLYNQQAAAKTEVGKLFPQEQELAVKTARLIELDMELNLDGKGQPQPEQAIAKSARPSVLDRLKAPPVHGAPEKPHKKEMEAR